MKLFHKFFLIITIIFFALLVPSLAKANHVLLGDMELNDYCKNLGQGEVSLQNNTWKCQSGITVNLLAACVWQYNPIAIPKQDVAGDPYSWACYNRDTQSTPSPTARLTPAPTSGPQQPTTIPLNTPTPSPVVQRTLLGDMDLDDYCRDLGQGGVSLQNGTWRCQSESGQVVNLNAACVWQYTPSAVAVQDVAGDPYSWACYTFSNQPNATPTPALTPTPTPTIAPSPTPTASASPTPTATPTPAPTELRTRRSIYSLSTDEVQRLVNAINVLRNNGQYQDFIDRHIQAMMAETPVNDPTTDRNVAHRGPAFLTWHRAYIYEFEERLRAVDPTVTLPYWPFESDSGRTSRVFSAAYFGSDGNQTQNDRVTDGSFANWGIIRRIGRDQDTEQTSLPSTADVNSLLQFTSYDVAPYNEQSRGFVMGMEGWIGTNSPWGFHNRVHGFIGGDMGTMDSANDPMFFLVHANVDRIWWRWQQTQGINNFQPVSGGPAGHNLNDPLRFLLRMPTNADVLDIQEDMGYTYN